MLIEENFLALSKLLTGISTLEVDLVEGYYHSLENQFGPLVDEVLGVYKSVISDPNINPTKHLDEIVKRIKSDEKLVHVLRQIVKIWYVSQFKASSDPADKTQIYAGHFDKGWLWKVIKAHPPAFSDLPHGYWVDPPPAIP
jgi:hypothetical protein